MTAPTPPPEIVFRTEGVTRIYASGEVMVRALDGVDLAPYAGELTVLLGPSGSGKSTLLNILGGLDHVCGGHVWFRDTELTTLNDRALTRYRRDHVGFSFFFDFPFLIFRVSSWVYGLSGGLAMVTTTFGAVPGWAECGAPFARSRDAAAGTAPVPQDMDRCRDGARSSAATRCTWQTQ